MTRLEVFAQIAADLQEAYILNPSPKAFLSWQQAVTIARRELEDRITLAADLDEIVRVA